MDKRAYRMRRWISGAIISIAITGIFITQSMASDSDVVGEPSEPKITAHRGASSSAPENTIAAIEQAVAAGADMVEIDVRRTRDGVLVLMHDSGLTRTTGQEGCVEDYSYQVLKNLDAGGWFAAEFEGVRIPTLEEVLSYCRGRIGINIEIKSPAKDDGVGIQVAKLLREYDMQEQCIVTSFQYKWLQEVKQAASEIRTGIILDDAGQWSQYRDMDLYSLKYSRLTAAIVSEIHEQKKEVHVWTVDNADEIAWSRIIGVDNIITNNPEYAQSTLVNLSVSN